ncbi:MAG: pyrroline-5-carboxylate reductase [Pseudobdellovibrionaceae bacterium]
MLTNVISRIQKSSQKSEDSAQNQMESRLEIHYKIGFIGVGNMAQAMIKGLIESKTVAAKSIYGTNRSEGKLQKATDFFGIQACNNNEELIDQCDVVILTMKPQDLSAAIDPIAASFREGQIVISLAAGVTLRTLQKKLPQCRVVRLMANTPALIQKGMFAYVTNKEDAGIETLVEDLCEPLGSVFKMDDEDQFEAFTVSCASGTGFVYEFMMYFQDWILERGFEPEAARKMVVETFLGASLLAEQSKGTPIEELQSKVTSKKGITSAGLQSMRELEIERALRYSFEKAALRNQELAKEE